MSFLEKVSFQEISLQAQLLWRKRLWNSQQFKKHLVKKVNSAPIKVELFFIFRFNAYAIDKPEEPRNYKSLYASAGSKPDFHALQYFLPYDGNFIDDLYSDFWSNALKDGQ